MAGLIPFLGSMGLECPSYHNPADFVMEVQYLDGGPRIVFRSRKQIDLMHMIARPSINKHIKIS